MTEGKLAQAKNAALEAFRDSGPGRLNCAQAVLRFSLLMMEAEPELVTAARYFGGGIARTGQICGAVSGAALSLGFRDHLISGHGPDVVPATIERLQVLMRGFENEFGALPCATLLGCEISTPESYKRAKESGATERCSLFVSWVCDQLAPLLGA
jgi:C_GCAxxG_C_C family probable redox protein